MILVLVLSTWIHVAAQQQHYYEPVNVRYTKSLRNTLLTGMSLQTSTKERVEDCLFYCSAVSECGSVNYHAVKKLCVLSANEDEDEVTIETSLVKVEGWVYYEKEILRVNIHSLIINFVLIWNIWYLIGV